MKKTLSLVILSAIFLTACNLNTSPQPPTNQAPSSSDVPASTPDVNFGEQARGYIQAITNFGPRIAGSQAEAQAAQYIQEAFTQMGFETELQPFSLQDPNGVLVESFNVIATRIGRSEKEIIAGAHYDSIGSAPGADDNASGVAVLLEAASLLKNDSTPYTIRLVAFGAGENGNLGAAAYRDHMSQLEFENALVMINLDSLIAGNTAYLYSSGGIATELRDWALEWAFGNSLDLQTVPSFDFTDTTSGREISDYAPFWAVGIPVLAMQATDWTLGNADGVTQVDTQYGENGVIRHTSFDSLDYLDQNLPGRVDGKLAIYIPLLYHILSQYEVPVQ